ncbi:hypothetical protein [Synechococcus virus S-ESS1]|uniref:Uncharacterized protein n=1 Tax=Synechococcus virus S-ESS1 TaxID=1964565 RepID=A0A1V0DX71_9CAUD|nr:tail assembly chaperone [Synechococcus virus S-ESS1]ARB05707.1 hypothetical protein [Synechococcus virus S-ESS1]
MLTMEDVRKSGFCVRGAKAHCTELGIDFKGLVKNGFPLAEAEAIQDAHVQRIVAVAKKRIADGRRR